MGACLRRPEVENQQDLVSVIVPIYNMEKHLDRCLESILGQTYENLEVLLIDDGSTDGSLEIMNAYARRDSRVRVFHKENGGVSSARNLGLKNMQGEYCIFVDPDDCVVDVYVEWLLAALVETGADIAICNATAVPPSFQNNLRVVGHKGGPAIETIPLSDYELWGEKSHAVCWGAVYSKELLGQLLFDTSLAVGEDSLFFIQYLLSCKTIVFLHNIMYFYIQHADSTINKKYTPSRWTEIIAWQIILSLRASMPKKLYDSAEIMYMLNCLKIMGQLFDSPYYDRYKIDYLIREIRRHHRAIPHIPRDKHSIRIKIAAAMLFPRLTQRLLWIHQKHKERKLRNVNRRKGIKTKYNVS